jgi:hypothetical protein
VKRESQLFEQTDRTGNHKKMVDERLKRSGGERRTVPSALHAFFMSYSTRHCSFQAPFLRPARARSHTPYTNRESNCPISSPFPSPSIKEAQRGKHKGKDVQAKYLMIRSAQFTSTCASLYLFLIRIASCPAAFAALSCAFSSSSVTGGRDLSSDGKLGDGSEEGKLDDDDEEEEEEEEGEDEEGEDEEGVLGEEGKLAAEKGWEGEESSEVYRSMGAMGLSVHNV